MRLRNALEHIASLDKVTEIRGEFKDIGALEHNVTPDGFVPIHPRTLEGLFYAANIAKMALKCTMSTPCCPRSDPLRHAFYNSLNTIGIAQGMHLA